MRLNSERKRDTGSIENGVIIFRITFGEVLMVSVTNASKLRGALESNTNDAKRATSAWVNAERTRAGNVCETQTSNIPDSMGTEIEVHKKFAKARKYGMRRVTAEA